MSTSLRSMVLPLVVALGVLLAGCDSTSMNDEPSTTTFNVEVANVGTPQPLLKSGPFAQPVGASENGPAGPGAAYEFSFTAGPNEVPMSGMQLSFATMFIQSNDLFYAFQPGGIALFDGSGQPIGLNSPADVTDQVALWDAGTEGDEEPGTGPNQAPRQSGPDTGPDGEGTLVEVTDTDGDGLLDNDGFSYPAVADVIRVTVESEEDAASGGFRFTVRIENVTDETGARANGEPIPLSPGAFAAHFDQVPATGNDVAFFVADAPESESIEGIEEIAEDGDPSVRGEAAAGLTGVTVPLSPGAVAVHSDAVQLFESGEAASDGIAAIAEDGLPGTLDDALGTLDGVRSDMAFGTDAGPLPPATDSNPSYQFTVEAQPGDRLSLATMYIQSNDLFYAFQPEGLALFDNNGAPISRDVTDQVALWDAGTEGDEEPGVGLNQAVRQSNTNTGPDGEGSIVEVVDTDGDGTLDDDGFDYLPTDQVIRITITPQSN